MVCPSSETNRLEDKETRGATVESINPSLQWCCALNKQERFTDQGRGSLENTVLFLSQFLGVYAKSNIFYQNILTFIS